MENAIKAINKANSLKNLNAFITLTNDLALKQAEISHTRILKHRKKKIFYETILKTPLKKEKKKVETPK